MNLRRIENWHIFVIIGLGLGILSCQGEVESGAAIAMAERAQEQYDAGQFDRSVDSYVQLIAQEGPSTTLLYNLGCGFYRGGDLGRAVAAWESALKLAPRDPDILHNLRIANERSSDRLPEIENSSLVESAKSWLRHLSPDEWSVVAYGSFLLFLLGIGLRISPLGRRNPEHFGTALFVALILQLVAGSVWVVSILDFRRDEAVIVAGKCDVYSGPDASGEILTTVHAGLKAKVVGKAGTDELIRLQTGWQGYVPTDSTQPVGLDAWESVELAAAPENCRPVD